ncbi:hypothetical protein [Methanogenium cariaci]|uniref:hypothetical protein n=1 Tax=Methanogenium cariaci TaxID=2197 RepID=UPI001FE047F0|nr:hypothetical protein [Methanogenium cariaci]
MTSICRPATRSGLPAASYTATRQTDLTQIHLPSRWRIRNSVRAEEVVPLSIRARYAATPPSGPPGESGS